MIRMKGIRKEYRMGDSVLAALAGGLFVGVGVGLVVRAGGASGGDDALALIIARISRLPISLAFFFTDFTVRLSPTW